MLYYEGYRTAKEVSHAGNSGTSRKNCFGELFPSDKKRFPQSHAEGYEESGRGAEISSFHRRHVYEGRKSQSETDLNR